MTHTLEVDSVRLVFNNHPVLSDIYLKCETGTITGLLGRNGSGKSSLMKIIFGSLRAENQSVRLDRQYVHTLYQQPQAVHYLPQSGFSLPYLTGQQLLQLFVTQPEHYEALMQVAEIYQYQQERLGALSAGLQKFWEVMLLLYADSKFILLDEPFSGISPLLVEKLSPHFQRQSQYKGIVITDHWYKAILSLSHTIVLLVQGQTRLIRQREDLYEWGYLPPS
uniref:ATP-binding cassette domain-containing protein n=1 Tax=Roseihalotalea indica TaxID=2867963 RepID=A0AA49JFR9_9BACT|nr:ATP-binding cassette domain-containing protein [Tunicatimonas sp. TK19036]